jgi:hypothetical protein
MTEQAEIEFLAALVVQAYGPKASLEEIIQSLDLPELTRAFARLRCESGDIDPAPREAAVAGARADHESRRAGLLSIRLKQGSSSS